MRVVHLDAAPLDAPLVASGGGVCGGAGSGRSGGGGGSELVAKRCVSAQDLERLEASVLSPAMFGMNLLGSEQPVMDDFTVVLRARALLPPCPHAADADAADAGAGTGPLAAPLRVVAGAAELGVAWEPLLSSLAYRGETAVFEASGPTAAALGAGLDKAQAQAAAVVTAATAAEGGTHCGDERGRSGESAHGGSEAVGGCNDEEEETARAHEWAGLVFGPTAAEASALAARGVRQFGVQVLDIIAPPDKRDASAATQLAYLRALRRRAARLFSEGQPALSACKWRRLLWMLQDLPAASIFNPDAPAEELLPSPLVYSHALRGGDRGDRGDGGEGGVSEGVSEGCEGGGEGKGGKSSAEELNELWRAGALGVAACALRQQQYALAQAACRCVVKQCPACADAHVRLAHALYAERHLDGAVESLCTAVRLRPSHKEARELHAHMQGLLEREIGLLQAARSRQAASAALAPLAQVPTERAIATVEARCTRARRAVQDYNRRNPVDRTARDWIYGQGPQLERRRDDQCRLAGTLSARRKAGLTAARALKQANARYDALAAQPADTLRQVASGEGRATLRDLLEKAALLLIGILLTPYVIRLLFWFVLAPLAMRRGAIRIAVPGGRGPAIRQSAPSAVSTAVDLQPGEELLVRQNYLQTLSDAVESRTKWLLDARHPLSSMASGMMFLTRIRGDGQTLTVSDTQNAFAEVAIIDLPAGSACVLQPRALAAVVQQRNAPMRITSHWRLFSLNALLTMQLRFLVFHGPARLVLKGGRGVRVEPAREGRILGQEQMVGFSADLAYSVTRNETFWPYFLGRESLLKDKVRGGSGVLIIEESPLASQRGGVRGGLEGMVDAGLKAFGL